MFYSFGRCLLNYVKVGVSEAPALIAALRHHFRQTADIMITAVENAATLSFGYALLGDH